MRSPLISVIIPCYNSAKYIPFALESILKQTYNNLEIIIVDDNSIDNPRAVISPYLEKYSNIIFQKLPFDDPQRKNKQGQDINAGWAARNFALQFCSGKYITFQDADDGSFANRIEVQYNFMQIFGANHITIGCQSYQDQLNGQILEYDKNELSIITNNEIQQLIKKTQRRIFKIPFSAKELQKKDYWRLLDRKYIRNWTPYPGTGGAPLVKTEVFDQCHFRQLYDRVWPSGRGRGADRDFNFWVAETFQNSLAINLPLYLWRTDYIKTY